jgi:hypothetical protein
MRDSIFPELKEQEKLAVALKHHSRIEVLAQVQHQGAEFPILGFSFGTQDPRAPVLGIFGGVHGLERIGSQVALSFLQSILGRILWDETLHWQLSRMRLIFAPLINPVGMLKNSRANGRGVDLMRNCPVVADGGKASFLVGGHRISPRLPWYQGDPERLEVETQAVVDWVRKESFESKSVIHLDIHSGFGVRDQVWFPFARTQKPFDQISEVHQIKALLDGINPNHVYVFEPQAKNYTTHGDLWDYLFSERMKHAGLLDGASDGAPKFIPLTLEMGSWMWVKKNPLQLFSYLGPFNPIKPHRKKRILRRHLILFDQLLRISSSPKIWSEMSEIDRKYHAQRAKEIWYNPSSLT